MDPEVSRGFVWEPCGTIPGVPGAPAGGEPSVTEGHLIVPDGEITSLSITADGKHLASAAGELLVWELVEPFEDSVPTWISASSSERPTVQLSPDARLLARSGDGRDVFTVPEGEPVGAFAGAFDATPEELCRWPELRFSPDGRWLVGAGWKAFIEIFSVAGFAQVGTIPAPCGTRVTFSADGGELVTSGLARFRTSDWQQTLAPSFDERQCTDISCYASRKTVVVSPDGSRVVTSDSCSDDRRRYCTFVHENGKSTRMPDLTAPYPAFSPEGHWLVAGGTLVHLPSGTMRVFHPNAVVALFAPDGDIIAGDVNFGLTRYCMLEST